ncbi:MAG: type IX secretion system protein PorQ [Ignavibacteriae bacterium]|nr:type IX secretion system protein PorQ [Ignavibacteriota bacterium]
MKFRSLSTSLALVFGLSNLFAANNTVYDFLRTDMSARAGALAGSYVTITNDVTSIFYNPAGLSTLEKPSGSLGFFKHLLDINSGYVTYSQPYEDLGYFGVGVQYMNYGTFNETDDLGNVIGEFNASDLAVSLGYSNAIEENLFWGANAKFIYSSIAGHASTGLAADLGILYTVPESRITLGASLRNLGAQISSYMSTKEKLPLDLVVGVSVVPKGLPLLLNLNFHKLNEDAQDFGKRFKAFSIGGEFTLSRVLQARVGFNNEQRSELKTGTSSGLAGFSGGIGITVQDYKLDYGLSSLGSIGSLHRITISSTF